MNRLIAAIVAAGQADRLIGGPRDQLGHARAKNAHMRAELALQTYLRKRAS